MHTLPTLLAGYSLFCALAIALTHFGGEANRGQGAARVMGLLLLAALAGLQGVHVVALQGDGAWTDAVAYRAALFVVAPCFFLYSRSLLSPKAGDEWRAVDLVHVAPVGLSLVMPGAWARSMAFVVGAGYLLWLGRRLLALRAERARFQVEVLLLGVTFLVAVAVAVLGLLPGALPGVLSEQAFTGLYAAAIGLAFLLVQVTLHLRPQLEAEVREVVRAGYAQTTLGSVDCDAALGRLQELMAGGRLYADADLSLASLAARLGLNAHQLSELLNSRLGKSYARYVREQRVEAAKAMLRDEPTASVLSVGLSVGFATQSNFYDAFREIEGTTPGQYRKLTLRPGAAG
ncbi:helix-turn-helix domain-containing protein [Leptothrix sp. BB-4]